MDRPVLSAQPVSPPLVDQLLAHPVAQEPSQMLEPLLVPLVLPVAPLVVAPQLARPVTPDSDSVDQLVLSVAPISFLPEVIQVVRPVLLVPSQLLVHLHVPLVPMDVRLVALLRLVTLVMLAMDCLEALVLSVLLILSLLVEPQIVLTALLELSQLLLPLRALPAAVAVLLVLLLLLVRAAKLVLALQAPLALNVRQIASLTEAPLLVLLVPQELSQVLGHLVVTHVHLDVLLAPAHQPARLAKVDSV